MKIFHVVKKDLKEMHDAPYTFLNGDVYVVDDRPTGIYIWLGSKSYADDRCVGAWAAKYFDMQDDSTIHSEVEGKESSEFKGLLEFKVVEGDTPGFLKHVDLTAKYDYALYHVRDTDLTDGSSSDDIDIDKVPLDRSSLKNNDVFVLDGGQDLYIWVGKNSQVGEKSAGNRLARKFDVERKRTPMIYTIQEGNEPPAFFELLDKIKKKAKTQKKAPTKKKPWWKFW